MAPQYHLSCCCLTWASASAFHAHQTIVHWTDLKVIRAQGRSEAEDANGAYYVEGQQG